MGNLIPTLSEEEIKSFWSRVKKVDEDECWNWKIKVTFPDRPRFYLKGKYYNASRVAYFIVFDKQPGNLLVCHTCDNPICMNPYHFFLGRDAENNKDKESKNRGNHPLKMILEDY